MRDDNIPPSWKLRPKRYKKGDKNHYGGKCVLPQSILEHLVAIGANLPYIFEISHTGGVYRTNCGVLEFTGIEGIIDVPDWMYQQLDLMSSRTITLKLIGLPIGKYVKLLPHSVNFLEIENHKAELEKHLTNYQVLTQGDEILCEFEEVGPIRFTVAEIKPEGDGIYIVDTDLSVEFMEPIGYSEKIENERTVMRYMEIEEGDDKPRIIRMKKMGLFFDYKALNKNND